MKSNLISRTCRCAVVALMVAPLLGCLGGSAAEDAKARAHAALVHQQAFKDWLAEANYEAGLAAYEAKDYKAAFEDWREVADTGDAEAELRLGKLSEEGLGVPQNYIEAHRWYNLAAAAGAHGAVAARDALAAKMSKEQLGEAQRLAAVWRPPSRAPPAAGVGTAALPEAPSASASSPPSAEAVVHFKAGLAAFKAGSLDAAIAELSAGLALSPDAVALFLLGEAYRLSHQDELALKAYDDALALDPASTDRSQGARVRGLACRRDRSEDGGRDRRGAAAPQVARLLFGACQRQDRAQDDGRGRKLREEAGHRRRRQDHLGTRGSTQAGRGRARAASAGGFPRRRGCAQGGPLRASDQGARRGLGTQGGCRGGIRARRRLSAKRRQCRGTRALPPRARPRS